MSKFDKFSGDELVDELIRRGLFVPGSGSVHPHIYKLITEAKPICCVDVLPVRDTEDLQIGVIKRKTGSEAGRLALIGGGIDKNELIEEAIKRHLKNDLGITKFSFHPSNSLERPFRYQQYLHQLRSKSSTRVAFDPSKHAEAKSYLIIIQGKPKPKEEAGDFKWLSQDQIPKETAYNHGIVMRAAFTFLEAFKK